MAYFSTIAKHDLSMACPWFVTTLRRNPVGPNFFYLSAHLVK